MEIKLVRATENDAELIHKMQVKAFISLLDKYQDFDTSPANESIDKVLWRIHQDTTYFYLIEFENKYVGAIRIIDNKDGVTAKRISPLFVLPEYQNKGIAQKAIIEAEKIHGSTNWELETILQEKGNCYLYEKMGYHTTGKTEKINDRLTLVFYTK